MSPERLMVRRSFLGHSQPVETQELVIAEIQAPPSAEALRPFLEEACLLGGAVLIWLTILGSLILGSW
jgi:hypothetical protein